MEDLIRTLNTTELRQYVKLARSCKLGATFEVEGKVGNLVLDFTDINNADSCSLVFKRKSGNGKLLIISNEKVIDTAILSQTSQAVHLDLHSKIINIKRPPVSIGVIELIEVCFYSSQENTAVVVSNNTWKSILNKCVEYKSIKPVDSRLLASEGAHIKTHGVVNVATFPPNMYIIQDNLIKFLGPCEIINLDVLDGPVAKPVEPFKHIDPAAPILLTPAPSDMPGVIIPPQIPMKKQAEKMTTTNTNDKIIFDSSSFGNLSSYINKNGRVAGKGVILSNRGFLSIPIGEIRPYYDYVLVLEANSIVGNGKVFVSINSSGSTDPQTIILLNNRRHVNVLIKSGPSPAPGDTFTLTIDRSIAGTGDVAIERVMLLSNYDALSTPPKPMQPMERPSQQYAPDGLSTIALSKNFQLTSNKDRKFVIVIPSYNNEKWVEQNILSALNQNYRSFRVIFVDDCSSDKTYEIAKRVADNHLARSTVIKNQRRLGALENLYNAIHSCADDEIVLTLDGDDWLEHTNVLQRLNEVYRSGDIWLTYGQYRNHPDGGRGVSQPIPQHIVKNNAFRNHTWCASHLRTFYAWLFKKIARSDLMMDPKTFYPMTWDFAIMFPMLEMAGQHSSFLSDILYVYNLENPINDHKVNRNLQASLDHAIRSKQRYAPISVPITDKDPIKVGLILIATNKYQMFLRSIVESADKFFFSNADKFNITYYIFTDSHDGISTNRDSVIFNIPHRPFPYASMDRFRHFTTQKDVLGLNDYLFYVDVDSLFVDHIGEEVLGRLVGVRHCGFYSGGGTFETNMNSVFYLPRDRYRYYYGGGFSGGAAVDYLALSKWCADKIDEDIQKGIMPIWHDETAINTYFANNPPEKSLTPSYHYPQTPSPHFKMAWAGEDFQPKILLLDKSHTEIR